MTAAFAFGQIAGPLLLAWAEFRVVLEIAAQNRLLRLAGTSSASGATMSSTSALGGAYGLSTEPPESGVQLGAAGILPEPEDLF